jgi:hypothetical protein
METPTSTVLEAFFQSAACTRCKGQGHRVYDHRPSEQVPCIWCNGTGTFSGVDVEAIKKLITAGKGPKARLRASWPSKLSPWRNKDTTVRRAYYVWRLARFHGGADVTMPVTAAGCIEGDPHIRLLDALSDVVAKKVFGTDRAASHRWGRLLGFVKEDAPGLPSSAYEGGPIVTSGQKPEFEAIELT